MDHVDKYYASALFYLQYRSRSEREIREYLKRKKASEEVVEHIVSKLKEQKFLDDEAFAKMWIESRIRSKPRSQRLLKIELRRKGIHEDIIDLVFDNTEGEVVGDTALAKKLAEKKIRRYTHLPREEIYVKLGSLLARHGFNWETIKTAIDEILKEGYNRN